MPCPICVGHFYEVQNLHFLACSLHPAVSDLDAKLCCVVIHYRGFLCS